MNNKRMLAADARFDQHAEQVSRMVAADVQAFAAASKAIQDCCGNSGGAARARLLEIFAAPGGDEAFDYVMRLANIGVHFISARMLERSVAG